MSSDLLAGPLNVAKMQADVDRWIAYMRPAVMATKGGTQGGIRFDFALNAASWEASAKGVRANIQTLRDRIAGVVDGKPFRQ